MYKPVLLVILDGWGISNNSQGNVLKETVLPTIDKLNRFYPMTTLQASGISVGLFWGESGNSEVGHMIHQGQYFKVDLIFEEYAEFHARFKLIFGLDGILYRGVQ